MNSAAWQSVPRRPPPRRRSPGRRSRRLLSFASPARSSGRFGGLPRRATRSRPARRRRRLPEEGARELASLAQAFNEMAEQLAASRESERNFLLSVSHELKTPLTAIRGYAEGLAEGAFGAEDASRTILVEARRLERLVRDLLDLARMNRHEFSVRREAVDLGEVAREAVARHEASRPGVRRLARRRGRRVVGRGRPRPAAPGRLEPGRERAPRDAAGGVGDRSRRAAAPRRLRHRARGSSSTTFRTCLRPVLPLRQVRPRAAGRKRPRARDRQASSPRRWAGRSRSNRRRAAGRPSS